MANGLSDDLAKNALLGKQDQSLMDTAVSAGVPQETLGLMFNALAGPNVNYDTQSGILTTRGPQRQGTIDMMGATPTSVQQPVQTDANLLGNEELRKQELEKAMAIFAENDRLQRRIDSMASTVSPNDKIPGGRFGGQGTVLKEPNLDMSSINNSILGAGVPNQQQLITNLQAPSAFETSSTNNQVQAPAAQEEASPKGSRLSRIIDFFRPAAEGQLIFGAGGPTAGRVTTADATAASVLPGATVDYLTNPDLPTFSESIMSQADKSVLGGMSPSDVAQANATQANAVSPVSDSVQITGAGTVLKEPSQIMSEAGVPTMQETIAGLTELAAPTAPTAPTLPAGVEPGSPQATFLAKRARGELSPAQIAQAEEFARSMGTTFDPETGYSRQPFLSAQASRLGRPMEGQTLSQFMRYEDQPIQRTEQFVDPQGRIRRRATEAAVELMRQDGFDIPQGVQPLAPEFTGFEQEAALRRQRMDARPDFMVAQPVSSRADKQYTDAQLRDIFGGGDALQRAKAMQDAGIDPVTGKRPEEKTQAEQELEQARLDLIRAQTERARREEPAPDPEAERIARETAQARLDLINKQIEAAGKADPDKLAKVTAEADRLIEGGVLPQESRQAYILGQMGADVDEILGAGIPTPDGEGKDSLGLGL